MKRAESCVFLLLLASCDNWSRSDVISAIGTFATILYLAATVAIFVAARRANKIAQEAARIAEQSTNQALDETRRSNALTERSVAVAEEALHFTRESFHLLNRPRLHITQAKVLSGNDVGDPRIQAGFVFKNLGNLTANEVAIGHAFYVKKPGEGELDISVLPTPRPELAESVGSLGPGEPVNITPAYAFGEVSQKDLLDGHFRLFLGGVAEYVDDTKTTYRYRFAYQFKPRAKNWTVGREQHEIEPLLNAG